MKEKPKSSKSICEEAKERETRKQGKKPTATKPPKIGDGSSFNQTPVLEFPHFLRVIGPNQIKILMGFVPSAICYSLASLVLVVYLTDWRPVVRYLPYYNGRFADEDESG
ncbi:hypothetical protein Zmor_000581 [Zophobas morio]|uniref:Transmembrane protein n=1 Tax=Zophobas morio TaxID=2755281 RepID=A0AA38J521_9CUCU|nr:hypothetical protein Zmor_000581 [Zophobas morio]